jgi:HK97 family phage major capsid protein
VKSLKALIEEREGLAFEARGIYEAVQKADREFTDEEDARFKEITDDKSGLIAMLNGKIKETEEREQAIADIARRDNRKKVADQLTELTNAPRRVLPINGEEPADEGKSDRIYVRATKLRAFKSDREAFDSGMWMRAISARIRGQEDRDAVTHCLRRGLMTSNTAYEYSGPQGGYLVPAPISTTIIDVREQVGVARRVANIQPMTADTLTIPKKAGGLTVYYVGETATITDSDKTWDQIELITKKRAVASKISQELVDDALISIVDNVVSEMAYALALKEDEEMIDGDGTSSYGGVRGLLSMLGAGGTYTAPSGDDTWAELAIDDFTSTMGKLPSRYSVDTAWICSSEFYYTSMVKVSASAGGNSIQTIQGGPTGAQFMGRPVYFSHFMPTATAVSTVSALYGNFREAVLLGARTAVRVDRDDSTGFLTDLVTLKATTRYDIKVHEGGTASVAGAYVGLKTAAS